MSKTLNFDKKIQEILAATKPGERTCVLTGEKWMMDEEHLQWCCELKIPPSQYSPKTRIKILTGFCTGIGLWKNRHARTGASLISLYHPDSPFHVVSDREWFEMDFLGGQIIDTAEPIIPQLEQLILTTPQGALDDNGTNIRSVGVSMDKNEDCYLSFGGLQMRRIDYLAIGSRCEDSVDLTNAVDVSESSSINLSQRLFNCHWVTHSSDCVNSIFLFDCRNCEHCFGATNKRNKKYLFFNQQLSKGEWEKTMAEIDLSKKFAFDDCRSRFEKLMGNEAFWPKNFSQRSQDCDGDYMYDCLRCRKGFWQLNSRDCFWSPFNEDCERVYFGPWLGSCSDLYSSANVVRSQQVRLSYAATSCLDIEYCHACRSCEHCFGCVGLRHKKFCIFNRQYTEEEYWPLVDKIKTKMLESGEYGQFFSSRLSPFGFQFAIGELFSAYSGDDLELLQAPIYDVSAASIVSPSDQMLKSPELPNDSANGVESLDRAIFDPDSHRIYSIVQREFDFYRRHRLPLPRVHPLERLRRLCKLSNAIFPEPSRCDNCRADIEIHPNQTYKNRRVYCQKCYLEYIEKNG